ncbi:ATP-bind-3 domain-containing protein [Mycena venus]|uniref:tRNA(Ile)-lysidine synthetase n=1 Tax=Mycena venus TaxID=2733690 RepID=A0A8H7CIX0_9AGAR|nr:ATP-bind-3 domain-containing protein [Mycena venus]
MTTWYPEGYSTHQPYYYPPGPPPLSAATANPNPPPWRGYQLQPRKSNNDSGRSSSSQTQASMPPTRCGRSTTGTSSYPQLDFMDGIDYFKIGQTVRIRRWNAETDSFSGWKTGKVARPILHEKDDGTQKRARSYLCSYEFGQNKEYREKEFSPHLQEIESLEANPISVTPALRLGNNCQFVFAPIPVSNSSGTGKRVVYSPAVVLTSPNEQGGVRLRVLAGPAAKREIDNFAIKHAPPYNPESAQILQQKGFQVEGDVLKQPPPISGDEFARLLKRCAPSVGWPNKIAVAHSGGADSTCLLFLIHRYIQDLKKEHLRPRPSAVVSLSVDHGLQASSAATAKHCADYAQSLGIEHISSQIPWSEPPFPKKPQPGEAFEEIGRLARYQLLFRSMKEAGTELLALGHHGDDQVETSLMRLAKGSTELGAGGMRKVRRWGMGANINGDDNTMGWVGVEGMTKWMIRPLLEVSKERILATCAENNLEYVEDSTNFQPELTLRNAIRHLLNKKYPRLQMEDIENLVDSSLNRSHLPSPPATYLVSYRGLSTVRNPLVQRAIVLRLLRYVSFYAWGTARADGDRRRKSLELIVQNLWTPNPFAAGIGSFVAGGGAWWLPVVVGAKRMLFPSPTHPPKLGPGEITGWLACRQPPMRERRDPSKVDPLHVDITDKIRAKLQTRNEQPEQMLSVLWDCRFVLKINIDEIPDHIARGILVNGDRILVHPNTRWYWPKVIHLQRNRELETLVHSTLSTTSKGLVKLDRDTMASWGLYWNESVTSSWIEIEWIRSLSGL